MTNLEHDAACARGCWRILLQVVAYQMDDYNCARDEDKEQWIPRIIETVKRINEKAMIFLPTELPPGLPAPVQAYRVPNVTGNWLEVLTLQVTNLFSSVPNADGLKIDIFEKEQL